MTQHVIIQFVGLVLLFCQLMHYFVTPPIKNKLTQEEITKNE
jgi:hypothetical protein